jgi:DNA repair protein RadD
MMETLFADELSYSEELFPPEREFQTLAQQKIHEGWVAGHKNQMVMAPTGAGKTYLGLKMIAKTLQTETLLSGKPANRRKHLG